MGNDNKQKNQYKNRENEEAIIKTIHEKPEKTIKIGKTMKHTYTHTHTHIHTQIHTHAQTHTHTRTYT